MSTSSAFAITNNWETLVFILPVSILTIWLLVNPASKANWLCERFCPFLISLIRKPILIINSSSLAYCTIQNWGESKNNMAQICLIQNYRLVLHTINSQMKQINKTKSLIHLCGILIILTLGVTNTFAQPYETNPDFNRTRNWHFGYGIGLHFAPDTVYNVFSNISTDEAAAIHTDEDGNLLLYSNGEKIWNANHQIIHNGNLDLGHNSSRMGSVFAFHPDNPDSIYLFNTYWNISVSKELSFNLIVKEADTFRVAIKDSVLSYSICEPISVTKASNGKDIWIIVQGFETNQLFSYLITSKGLVGCPIISNSFSTPSGSPQAANFEMQFSSDGKYLVRSNKNFPPVAKSIEVYKFFNSNGSLEFLYSIDQLRYPVIGICFSKNTKNLFITERDSGVNVFKFYPEDSLSTVESRKKFIISEFSFEMQNVTYSDDIALAVLDSTHLFLIHSSDNFDSVSISEQGIMMGNNNKTTFSLPNFNKSYFHTPPIDYAYDLNCIDNTIQFYGRDTFQGIIHQWLITKQGSTSMTTNIKNPLIEFTDTGVHTVRYIATNGIRNDTITKEVAILPKITKSFLGKDTGWCENIDTSIIIQAPEDMHCYEWSTGSTGNKIAVDSTGMYWVKMTTPNFCVLYDTIIVSLDSALAKPIIYQVKDSLKTDTEAKVFQWYLNNQPIGTSNSFLKLTDTGIYSLKIMSNGGCESFSDTFNVHRVGLENINIRDINIYPNPFAEELIIELKDGENGTVSIFSILGKEILHTELVEKVNKIDTNQIQDGIYFILIKQNGMTATYKLIKHTK